MATLYEALGYLILNSVTSLSLTVIRYLLFIEGNFLRTMEYARTLSDHYFLDPADRSISVRDTRAILVFLVSPVYSNPPRGPAYYSIYLGKIKVLLP
jgi:hypothetical protein